MVNLNNMECSGFGYLDLVMDKMQQNPVIVNIKQNNSGKIEYEISGPAFFCKEAQSV